MLLVFTKTNTVSRKMDINKIYCVNCEEEVEYVTKKEKKTVNVRGRVFDVEITNAYCKKCGEQVFPDSIAKANDIIIFDEYRRLEGLLTSKEIKAIREKRHLSQAQLAKLINCGEKNITRYENGTIQDRAFDLLIRLVDKDDSYYTIRQIQNLDAPMFDIKQFFGNFVDEGKVRWIMDCDIDNGFSYSKEEVKHEYRTKTNQILCH